jgi:hypothetical protein
MLGRAEVEGKLPEGKNCFETEIEVLIHCNQMPGRELC